MQVLKRNNLVVDFEEHKIARAIIKAMEYTESGIDETIAYSIANSIKQECQKLEESRGEEINFSVEEIQDLVETQLMKSNRPEVAKRYILYRNQKTSERIFKQKTQLLSDDFLSKYKHAPSPFTSQLGLFIYYRTYSRFLPDLGRREEWLETVRRVVEYNCSLAPTTSKEAEELFDNIYNLRQFPSGRSLWVGGTDIVSDYGLSAFNCTFTVIKRFTDFTELFYLLMLGAGVGFRILKSDVANLPRVRTTHTIIHKDYNYNPEKKDFTSTIFTSDETVTIQVGDSKEGWIQALEAYFRIISDSKYRSIKTIIIDYDYVREKGTKLKKFGGTASGHESLKDMFTGIDRILKRDQSPILKLRPIHCLDICNIIGENVVSGGVRRTSEVGLIDSDDEECIKAKSNLYIQSEGKWQLNKEIGHRRYSNNSIVYTTKPTREEWHKHVQTMRLSGEPGFMNLEAAKLRRSDAEGGNPCFTGEMELLTANGYIPFKELAGREFKIVNYKGHVTNGRVWYTGIKEICEVHIEDRIIKCTPNHIFMLFDGSHCEAQNLEGKYVRMRSGVRKLVNRVIKTGKSTQVYDFSEPETHWGIVSDVVVHNCMEIILRNKGTCNLTTINTMSCVEKETLNKERLYRLCELSARVSYRMTCIELEMEEWNNVHKEDRLIGPSITGWQDMVNACKLTKDQEDIIKSQMREASKKGAYDLADSLGLPRPKLTTTVKPEGTLSLLPVVSSGVHYSHSPYYIRRVRISADDPLCKVCEDLEYPVYPEVGESPDSCKTKVIEFPVKAPAGKTKKDVYALEQLENYKSFMTHYCDQNVSITVHVRNNEWDLVEDWVYNNWNTVVAMSFLSYDESFHQLQPYEEITEEEYNKRKSAMKPFDPMLISKYEVETGDYELQDKCETGACPIR